MKDLIIQIIGGVIVAMISAKLNNLKNVTTTKPKRTGKILTIISFLMFFGGLVWVGSTEPQKFSDWLNPPALYGFTLSAYGIIFYVVGKFVNWFQKI